MLTAPANQRLKLTGAAILVCRASTSVQASPAAYPYCSAYFAYFAIAERTSAIGSAAYTAPTNAEQRQTLLTAEEVRGQDAQVTRYCRTLFNHIPGLCR